MRDPAITFVVCRQHAVPHSIWYPDARYMGLLADRDDVSMHIVGYGEGERQPELVDGVPAWRERSLFGLLRRVRALRPDVLFLESPCPELLAVPFARRTWVRAPFPAATKTKRRVQSMLMARADRISWLTPAQAAQWDVRDEQVVELFAAVDVDFFSEAVHRDPSFWTDRGRAVPLGPVLACIANVVKLKRQAELVRWLGPVLRRRPDVVVVIAGHGVDPEAQSEAERAVVDEGLDDQVLLAGGMDRSAVRQLLAWSSLHLVNSETEMMCMAMWEALAAGVLTLIPDLPQLRMLFPQLPTHASADDLRRNVEAYLDAPASAQQIVDSCRSALQRADVEHHDATFLGEWAELTRGL